MAMTDLSAWQGQYPQLDLLVVGDCSGDGLFNAQDINPFVVILTSGAGAGQAPTTEAPTGEYTEAPLASPVAGPRGAGRRPATAKVPPGVLRDEVMAPVLANVLAAGPANLDGDVEVDLFALPAVQRRNFGQAAHSSSSAGKGHGHGLGDDLIDVPGLPALTPPLAV